MDALQDLYKINAEGGPLENGGAVLYNPKKHTYISGNPYLTTVFAERAFRFANPAQAWGFIIRHPSELVDFEVR